MLSPDSIDPLSLPFVRVEDRKQLPATPVIYFAIDPKGAIQYIGRSINPRQRWQQHHRIEQVQGCRIAYLECDAALLDEIEQVLIEYFDPPLNCGLHVPPKFTKRDDRPAVQKAEYRIHCRLQEIIEAQGLTRTSLSEQTGLSQQSIRGLCDNTAKRYDSDTLAVLVDFFGIDVGDLLVKVKR